MAFACLAGCENAREARYREAIAKRKAAHQTSAPVQSHGKSMSYAVTEQMRFSLGMPLVDAQALLPPSPNAPDEAATGPDGIIIRGLPDGRNLTLTFRHSRLAIIEVLGRYTISQASALRTALEKEYGPPSVERSQLEWREPSTSQTLRASFSPEPGGYIVHLVLYDEMAASDLKEQETPPEVE